MLVCLLKMKQMRRVAGGREAAEGGAGDHEQS